VVILSQKSGVLTAMNAMPPAIAIGTRISAPTNPEYVFIAKINYAGIVEIVAIYCLPWG
jgi:hypothetical protein